MLNRFPGPKMPARLEPLLVPQCPLPIMSRLHRCVVSAIAVTLAACTADLADPTSPEQAAQPLADEASVPAAEGQRFRGVDLHSAQHDLIDVVTVRAIGRQTLTPVAEPGTPALGRGHARWRDSGATPHAAAAAEQLEWRRGTVSEIWREDELGLQHEIHIAERFGESGENLRIELALGEDANELVVSDNGTALRWSVGDTRWAYRGLRAFDAAGAQLAVHFDVDANAPSIVVDDRDAAYPIVVDPWMAPELQKLVPSFALGQQDFGNALAAADDWIVVGAPAAPTIGDGRAFVFRRQPAGDWAFTQTMSHGSSYQDVWGFGGLIDIGNGHLFIGSRYSIEHYTYSRTTNRWEYQREFVDPPEYGHFNHATSVGQSEGWLAIGYATGDTQTLFRNGAVRLFHESTPGTWTYMEELDLGPLARDNQVFGDDLVFVDNWLLVGAPGYRDLNDVAAGAVFAFERTGDTWTRRQEFLGTGGAAYGTQLAADGLRVAVGAGTAYPAVLTLDPGHQHLV